MSGKYLDYEGLNYLWSKILSAINAKDPWMWELDTTATSGTDYELWQAIQQLGWEDEVIEDV